MAHVILPLSQQQKSTCLEKKLREAKRKARNLLLAEGKLWHHSITDSNKRGTRYAAHRVTRCPALLQDWTAFCSLVPRPTYWDNVQHFYWLSLSRVKPLQDRHFSTIWLLSSGCEGSREGCHHRALFDIQLQTTFFSPRTFLKKKLKCCLFSLQS